MERKRRGKYVEGHEPWTALGIKANTFHARVKTEGALGDEAREAKRKALEIAGTSADDAPDDEAGVVEQAPVEAPAPIRAPVAPAAPEPVQAPVEPQRYSPAATLLLPSEPPPPAVAGATVNVTFRCPPSVYDRMREMAHQHRVKLQGIVAAAVEAYLTANKF